MSDSFDPYHVWLGIPPEDQPANHYRLLGLTELENDASVIESAAHRHLLFLKLQQNSQHADACQTLLNEVTQAKLCLLNASRKAAYDAGLSRKPESPAADARPVATAAVPTAKPFVNPESEPEPITLRSSADSLGRQLRKRKNTNALIIGACSVVVLLMAVGLWFAFSGNDETEQASSDGIGSSSGSGSSKRDTSGNRPTTRAELQRILEKPELKPRTYVALGTILSAEERVKELYPKAYDPKVTTGLGKLATGMIGRSERRTEPAAVRITLLKKARELAQKAKWAQTEFKLVRLFEEFQTVDVPQEMLKVFRRCEDSTDEKIHRWAAWRAMYEAHLAERSSQFAVAKELLESAQEHAKHLQKVDAYQAELVKLGQKFDKNETWFKEFLSASKTPHAEFTQNTWKTLGEYLCFHDGNWSAGWECFRRSKDPKLTDLIQPNTFAIPVSAEMTKLSQDWLKAGRNSKRFPYYRQQSNFFKFLGDPTPASYQGVKLPQSRLQEGIVHRAFRGRFLGHPLGICLKDWVTRNYGYGSGHAGQHHDHFSTQWSGWLLPPIPGKYTLHTNSDDGIRLYVDEQEKISVFRGGAAGPRKVVMTLGAKPHRLRVDFNDLIVTAAVSFRWEYDSLGHIELVPPQSLMHYPTEAEGKKLNRYLDTRTKSKRDEETLCIFDEQPEFLFELGEGPGRAALTKQARGGAVALQLTGAQRHTSHNQFTSYRICEKPELGEYRYFGFAWKKTGGKTITVQLRHQRGWGPSTGIGKCRYYAGTSAKEPFGASMLLDKELPKDWTVVIRDLHEDFGSFYLRGISFDQDTGQALFDQVYLSRTREALEKLLNHP